MAGFGLMQIACDAGLHPFQKRGKSTADQTQLPDAPEWEQYR
jgi:hypothetical protein